MGDIQEYNGQRLGTFPWSEWFADEEKSGGVILDLSIHDIDYANWIFGKPISITCKARKMKKHNMKFFAESTTTLYYGNNRRAFCEASWAEKPDFPFTTYAQIKGSNGQIEFSSEGIFKEYPIQVVQSLESYDGYYNELSHFIDCISNRTKQLAVDGNMGKLAVATCLAAIESAKKKGKKVFLDDILKK